MYQRYPAGGGQQPAKDRPPAPQSVLNAVKLMYAGAAVSAIEFAVAFTALSSVNKAIKQANPHASLATLHSLEVSAIVGQVVTGLVEVGLWVLVARLNLSGRGWARIVAAVLFALSTIALITTVLRSGNFLDDVFVAVPWLIGLGAIMFLWRRESSDFFQPSQPR